MLLHCTTCAAVVKAEKVASAEYKDGHPDDGGLDARVVLFKCPQCTEPMLVRQYEEGWREDEWGHEIPKYGAGERIYPVERRLDWKIPAAIRRSFEEARRCFDHRCYVAAVLMCRRTVEALCKHHGTKAGGLQGGLKELHAGKVIDDRLHEWAEALRKNGNLAAHDPEATFSRQDAEDLAEFTEAILQYVFVLSHRFDAFQARRAERQAEPAAKPAQVKSVNGGAAE